MNLQDQIADELGQKLCSAVDFEILSDILVKSCDWHLVELDTLKNRYHSVDVLEWCESHCHQRYKHMGRRFIFQDQGDAVNFALKWLE